MVIDDPATRAEVTAAFESYERALMSNDTATLDALFWDGAGVVRYGVGENLYGAAAIAAFRRERTGGAPPRVLGRVAITTFGTDFATASADYVRVGGTAIGRQMQTWVRLPEGWRVVAAHVSQMAEFS